MRTALRHIGDGIEWASLDEESPGTGKRRPGAHSLRHSAARHWLMVGKVPLNVVSQWLGHTNVQVTLRIYLAVLGQPTSGCLKYVLYDLFTSRATLSRSLRE